MFNNLSSIQSRRIMIRIKMYSMYQKIRDELNTDRQTQDYFATIAIIGS